MPSPNDRSRPTGQQGDSQDHDKIQGQGSTQAGPFGSTALPYKANGWAPFPIMDDGKGRTQGGVTGYNGVDLDGDRLQDAIRRYSSCNVATRMPEGQDPDGREWKLLGLDVDAYDDKPGARTLARWRDELGELPPTYISSSREDGVSGIRHYKVPADWFGVGGAPGVELVQRHHRHTVCAPSIHETRKVPYRWRAESDELPAMVDGVPVAAACPWLPEAYLTALERTGGGNGERAEITDDDIAAMRTDGEPCYCVEQAQAKYQAMAGEGLAHYDAMRDTQMALLRLGHDRHPGVGQALDELYEAYEDDRGSVRDVAAEFDRAMFMGAAKIVADPTPENERGCPTRVKGLGELLAARGPERSEAYREMVEKIEAKREAEAQEQAAEAALFMDGESFLRMAMVTSPPIWGSQAMDIHLWEPGESLMIVGPPGVGKSTLAHLLVWARLGLVEEVIDWPVEPSEAKVLYLAMDRPAQIGRAMSRLVRPEQWPVLKDRLVVRMGPLPVDITQEITWIRDKAQELGADLVVIDSIKDVLPKASDEERAGLYNMARQACLSIGIDWMELHHNRKAGVGNKEPDTLEDVYGARWLTAGAGSVISLHGESGASVVSMKQLKTPAGEFFPRWVELDKDTGQLGLHDNLTVEGLAAKATGGTSAMMIARKVYATEKPDRSQVQAVRNKLKRLAAQGVVEEYESPVDGSQMFRASNGGVKHSNVRATRQQRPNATPATEDASSQVSQGNAGSNNGNGSATFRGSLKEPDVAGADQEKESATPDPYAKARKRFPGKARS
jgi:hypothetical protein